MSIAEDLAAVRARIRAAAVAAGRSPDAVRLVAISKTRPAADLVEARAAGQEDFGENYAQELRDKADALGAGSPGWRWHFVGSLQRNKVKYIVGRAHLVHDVDSLALAEEIGKRSAPRVTSVLLGVNIGAEPQKSGALPGAPALEMAAAMTRIPGIELRGLMCIPPAVANPDDAAPYFAALAALAEEGRALGLPLHELSMGMSLDFEVAIRHGATLVRVGTAIFGARPPRTPQGTP